MERLDISKLQYVLFDWDNTLAESRSSLTTAVNQVLAAYGLPEWEISKQKRNKDLSFKDNFSYVFGENKAQKAYEEYREIYKKIVPSKISSFHYAQEVIDFFLTQGKKLMIVTNKERQLLEFELPFLYKPECFCNITCGHEAPADKPSGEQINFALKGYISPEEINPQTVWMIGDSHQDSRAAKAAGVQAIRVNQSIWGEVETKEPDVFYFKNFEELYAALKLAKN